MSTFRLKDDSQNILTDLSASILPGRSWSSTLVLSHDRLFLLPFHSTIHNQEVIQRLTVVGVNDGDVK